MKKQGITQQILTAYNRIGSIKGTAKECQTHWQRVVKILASNGVIISDTHKEILNLHNKGKSLQAIAKKVKLAESTVRAYLPAVRPIYNDANPSENAQRLKAWRRKKEQTKN